MVKQMLQLYTVPNNFNLPYTQYDCTFALEALLIQTP